MLTDSTPFLQPGKAAIVSHGAHPFRALMELLYSEKKPGEVPPKQLIVDLVWSLFDLYRASGIDASIQPPIQSGCQPNKVPGVMNYSRHISVSPDPSSSLPIDTLQACEIPGGYSHVSGFVLSLLRNPPSGHEEAFQARHGDEKANRRSRIIAPASELPAPKVEMHDFLAAAHKPRIFQTYLKELSQACWDFFW